MNYSLLSILPYHAHSELVNKAQKLKGLYLINALYNLGIVALKHFLHGHLHLFDAQVGENLCQIRAYQIFTLKLAYLDAEASGTLHQCLDDVPLWSATQISEVS